MPLGLAESSTVSRDTWRIVIGLLTPLAGLFTMTLSGSLGYGGTCDRYDGRIESRARAAQARTGDRTFSGDELE